jgi:hypothetical protein
MTAVENAQAKGWREVYFNPLTIPYWGIHVTAIVGVAITGLSWLGVGLAVAFYVPRMFFVTGGYHRYFSHRSYKTSRWFQFVLGLGATLTAQKGLLWWAARPRGHRSVPHQGLREVPRAGVAQPVLDAAARRARHADLCARRLRGVHLGVLRLPGDVLARDVHDQLAVAPVGRPALRDRRRLAQ